MLQTQSPIGKLILLTYKEPNLLENSILKEKVENLIDLIKFKTQTRGIAHTASTLQNDLFEIRIELLSVLLKESNLLKRFEEIILQQISNKYYLTGEHKKLGQRIADSLEVYFKIFSHLSVIISKEIANNSIDSSQIPSLTNLRSLLTLQPQPTKEIENYISWVEASLNFDYALIVSDLIFFDSLTLNKTVIIELEAFIKKSITDFGAYSMLTNFWHPEVDDESSLIRNIKIIAATAPTIKTCIHEAPENEPRFQKVILLACGSLAT